MDWFKGKSTGNHGFYHWINGGFRLKFSLKPIHGFMVKLIGWRILLRNTKKDTPLLVRLIHMSFYAAPVCDESPNIPLTSTAWLCTFEGRSKFSVQEDAEESQFYFPNKTVCTLWWTVTFCHGKSPFLMGKSTISMAIFHCYVSSPEGNCGSFWALVSVFNTLV